MTPLESKIIRDTIGIDTYERGFVYAALLLRASNTHPENVLPKAQNPYYNSVRIALSNANTERLINIQARLPYQSNPALRGGGNFIENILNFDNKDPNPFLFKLLPSKDKKLNINHEPSWVDTLEKYLAWCASNLILGFLNLTSGNQQGTILFYEEDTPTVLQINVVLPIDYKDYIRTNNLLYAVKSIITTLVSTDEPPDNSNVVVLSNDFILDNSALLGN